MSARILLILGMLLVIIGLLGFLAAAVALATADEVQGIETPEGVELSLPEDAPQVLERKRQAEMVLFGSLLCGGSGLALLGLWFSWSRR